MGGVPMKTEEQRPFAAAGGLCGAAYLAANRLLPGLPELLLGLLLGLGLALLVNAKIKCRTLVRAAYFLPYVLSVSVVSFIWLKIYDSLKLY